MAEIIDHPANKDPWKKSGEVIEPQTIYERALERLADKAGAVRCAVVEQHADGTYNVYGSHSPEDCLWLLIKGQNYLA